MLINIAFSVLQVFWFLVFFFSLYALFLCALKSNVYTTSLWHHLETRYQQQDVWADLPGAFCEGNRTNELRIPLLDPEKRWCRTLPHCWLLWDVYGRSLINADLHGFSKTVLL